MSDPIPSARKLGRLSELLLSSIDLHGRAFLTTIARNGSTGDPAKDYVPALSASDIVDGWKHVGRRYWYHPLHQISPYLGRFPPALARYFIAKFSQVDQVVYDPFCGSGTVPLEACVLDRAAVGSDVFIYAYTLSHAKVRPLSRKTYDRYVAYLKGRTATAQEQVSLADDSLADDLLCYYHEDTLRQLMALRTVLLEEVRLPSEHREAALFVMALVCGILHGDGPMYLSVRTKDTWSASVKYVKSYIAAHGLAPARRDVFECLERKASRAYAARLPSRVGEVIRCDITKKGSCVADSSVDLILTSPPYLRVRAYATDNWIRVWWLGADRRSETGQMLTTSDIGRYEQAMKQALESMFKALRDDRPCVIVAANVRLDTKDSPVYRTAGRLAEIGSQVGFDVIALFDDDNIKLTRRTSQLFNSLRYRDMADSVPHDSVLILSKGKCPIYDGDAVTYDIAGFRSGESGHCRTADQRA